MLLTTKQAAQKLGVRPNVVGRLVRLGKLTCANADEKAHADKRKHYEFDPKVIREFAATYVPIPPRTRKVAGNGHAPFLPLLDTTMGVPALDGRLIAIAARLDAIEEKVDALMAAWGITR